MVLGRFCAVSGKVAARLDRPLELLFQSSSDRRTARGGSEAPGPFNSYGQLNPERSGDLGLMPRIWSICTQKLADVRCVVQAQCMDRLRFSPGVVPHGNRIRMLGTSHCF
jgi:hypothetical protein